MTFEEIDRRRLRMRPLRDRVNRVVIARDHVSPAAIPGPLSPPALAVLDETVEHLRAARAAEKSRMLVFGAHTIKNGLSPVIIQLIERGWISHLATNGAGIIHDWEFAYCGESSEHVEANMREGAFGMWEETGRYINLALAVGAYEGLGYGESIGAFVEQEGLQIPAPAELETAVHDSLHKEPHHAAAAADLLAVLQAAPQPGGWLPVPHPFKQFGLQAAAYRKRVPFTGHPMFGHDIIYLHPLNSGAAVGRTAERDFLRFAAGVANLDGGVYLSVGSAVMSPMIFEKSLSMAQNLSLQHGAPISNHFVAVVDLTESHWDWTKGEPPETNPDYYLRYNKTFSRMGGALRYASANNRDFLLALAQRLG